MVSRVHPKPERVNGGYRPNAGRRFGSINEVKRVAQARARLQVGLLPHELLFEWALTGKMGNKNLAPSDRIRCAQGCAAWYQAPLPTRVGGDPKNPIVIQLDEKALAKLGTDQQTVLRDVLKVIAAGGAGLTELTGGGKPSGDAARYGASLHPDSQTAGRA